MCQCSIKLVMCSMWKEGYEWESRGSNQIPLFRTNIHELRRSVYSSLYPLLQVKHTPRPKNVAKS